MGRILPLVACFCLALLSSACTGAPTAQLDLVAQRAEQEAITVPWLTYVEADHALSETQKQSRRDTAATQDLRIRKAEAASGVTR